MGPDFPSVSLIGESESHWSLERGRGCAGAVPTFSQSSVRSLLENMGSQMARGCSVLAAVHSGHPLSLLNRHPLIGPVLVERVRKAHSPDFEWGDIFCIRSDFLC